MPAVSDTIVAIATAQGPGAVAVVRVSGPAVRNILSGLVGRPLVARQATVCGFHDASGERVDEGLALFFEAPASYTGEDVLELQGHGGQMLPQLVQQACLSFQTAEQPIRLALPGEFTQRAFLNDKLDLAQAEAVAALVSAGSRRAAKAALASLGGAFSDAVGDLQARLTDLRMRVEACLDFPEEDIEFVVSEQVAQRLLACQEALGGVLSAAERGRVLGRGMRLVLSGPPNVGKSSLLNALSEADVAIVTEQAGTTRDRLSQTISLDGIPIEVIDTAGLRETTDLVEQMGIARSWQSISEADLVVLLRDASGGITVDAHQEEQVRQAAGEGTPCLIVWNKSDLAVGTIGPEPGPSSDLDSVWISARTGDGLAALRSRLKRLAGLEESDGLGALAARDRQVDALRRGAEALVSAGRHLETSDLELLAEQLRLAQGALSEITGEFAADDLLGEIFGRFCIGK